MIFLRSFPMGSSTASGQHSNMSAAALLRSQGRQPVCEDVCSGSLGKSRGTSQTARMSAAVCLRSHGLESFWEDVCSGLSEKGESRYVGPKSGVDGKSRILRDILQTCLASGQHSNMSAAALLRSQGRQPVCEDVCSGSLGKSRVRARLRGCLQRFACEVMGWRACGRILQRFV